jgi:hypothetical protein
MRLGDERLEEPQVRQKLAANVIEVDEVDASEQVLR